MSVYDKGAVYESTALANILSIIFFLLIFFIFWGAFAYVILNYFSSAYGLEIPFL